MIKHVWTVLCEKSIIDNETNLVSLLDIVEKLEVGIELSKKSGTEKIENFSIPVKIDLVSMWQRESLNGTESCQVTLEYLDPKRKKLGELKNEIVFPDNISRVRARAKIDKMVFNESGIYTFVIKQKSSENQNWKVLQELPLEVNVDHRIIDK